MRDRETIDIALKAAETDHLVLSTLHTADVVKTIQRVIGVFHLSKHTAARLGLAENLEAIVAERLCQRADGSGRVPAIEIMRNTLAIRDSQHEREGAALRADIDAESPHTSPGGS